MTKVSISDKTKALYQLNDERETLFAKAKEVADKQQRLYEEFFIKMTQASNEQQLIIQKMGLLDEAIQKIMESGVYCA